VVVLVDIMEMLVLQEVLLNGKEEEKADQVEEILTELLQNPLDL